MDDKKEPQNFSLLLADADGGTLNAAYSRAYNELMEKLNDRALLNDVTAKGAITITIGVEVEGKSGKTTWKPTAPKVKAPAESMPLARWFQDQDLNLTRTDPRAVGSLYEQREKSAAAKGAAAPKMAQGQ